VVRLVNSIKNLDVRKEFDYDDLEGVIDDLEGVIDDWNNPYDQTIPVTVGKFEPSKSNEAIEVLGNRCVVCDYQNSSALAIDPINNNKREFGGKHLVSLIIKMARRGQDPSEHFQVLCKNCQYLKHQENKQRGILGLPLIKKLSLE